jgi:hypothetical protein
MYSCSVHTLYKYLPYRVLQVERPRAVVETAEDPLAPVVVYEDPQLLMEVPEAGAEPLSSAVLGAAAQPEGEDGDDPLPGELQLTHPHHQQHTYPGTRVLSLVYRSTETTTRACSI